LYLAAISYFFSSEKCLGSSAKSNNSTSNYKVAFAGIVGGDPDSPYAYSGSQVKSTF